MTSTSIAHRTSKGITTLLCSMLSRSAQNHFTAQKHLAYQLHFSKIRVSLEKLPDACAINGKPQHRQKGFP